MVEDRELTERNERHSAQRIIERSDNTSFTLEREHGDRKTKFSYSARPHEFGARLFELLGTLDILDEKLEIHHHEELENVTRFAGTIANPSYVVKWNDRIIYVDATLTEVTLTLDRAVDSRRILIIKTDDGANAVVIQAFTSDIGNDTIEGDASISLAAQFDKSYLLGDSDLNTWYRFKSSELI